jgi:hypothetical protein
MNNASKRLLVANSIGAIGYVVAAVPGWVNPGIPPAGEPFVWSIAVFPIIICFVALNGSWVIFLCIKRDWRAVYEALLCLPPWVLAVWIDFSHHRS